MPVGWESNLIVKSVFKTGADKIYLISTKIKKKTSLESIDKQTDRIAREAKKELEKLAEVKIIRTNFIDYFEALQDIISIIKREIKKESDIHINIAGGNKIISSVLLTAAFLHNLKVYYTVPKKYDEKVMFSGPMRKGISKIIEIPTLPLDINFTRKEKQILDMVKRNGNIGVKDYIRLFKHKDENKIRAQFHYYINKLQNLGIIKTEIRNKRRNISLTKTGRLILDMI